VVIWLFGGLPKVGTLPAPTREQLEPEGIIHVAEKVRVRQRFSGSVPGRRDGLSLNREKAVLVFTLQRLYALLPTIPRLKGPAIDRRWDAADTGAAKVEISEVGMSMHIALDRVDQRFRGDLSLQFDAPLTSDVLAVLPARSLSFEVPPEHVFQMLGVRVRT
jgi:hypothetical protein